MHITASVASAEASYTARVATDGAAKSVAIPPREAAIGSSLNGGELLFLALATCYVNDVVREGLRLGVAVTAVEVTVEGDFGGPGDPGANIHYSARVTSEAPEDEVRRLLEHTDTVAEIHNTLRAGAPVTLGAVEIVRP